jgi:NAD(P)-dependent dehydrogenase (short-subunit alcohol dehydrogenase family)
MGAVDAHYRWEGELPLRTYVVTGSSSGIGKAVAAALKADGDRVVGVDLHSADVVADLASASGRERAIEKIRDLVGQHVDGIVASAGVGPNHSAAQILGVNYYGTRDVLAGLSSCLSSGERNVGAVVIASACTQHPTSQECVRALLDMREEEALASVAGASNVAYTASKTAIVRWMRRTAPSSEWAGRGRSLNAVSPAIVLTPMAAAVSEADKARYLARYPMRLHGPAEAEDLVPLISFLIGPGNRHVTGQNIFFDGGADAVTRGDIVW